MNNRESYSYQLFPFCILHEFNNMLRILNIVSDEKFIDDVIKFHDMTSNYTFHEYVIIDIRRSLNLRYIKTPNRIISIHPRHFISYLNQNDFNAVFIHNLSSIPSKLITKIKSDIPVIWSSWGMDLYSLPEHDPIVKIQKLHHTKTALALNNNKEKLLPSIINKIRCGIKYLLSGQSLFVGKRAIDYRNAIKRVDFFTSVLPTEYDLIKKEPYFRATRIDYKYYNFQNFNTKKRVLPKEKKLLIGNSAAPTNNHLDVFEILRNLDLSGFQVILPLNYGASKTWISMIASEAKSQFKTQVKIINTFIPINDYFGIIDKCSHAILYHERQQALGNIYYLLESGCKLFLSENSITYKYLKDLGIHVYSIQSELTQENLDLPLESPKANHNNKIIYNLIRNEETAIENLTTLYSLIANFNSHQDK